MSKTPRPQNFRKLALIATAILAATISIAGCSTNSPNPAPTTSPSASAAAQAATCEANPSSAPLPSAGKFRPVPPEARISVALSGIESGTVKPGAPPAEVEVTLCNNTPVDYPKIGVVLVLTRCSCATYPNGLPRGSAERFDAATGRWVKLEHPVITTGADYLGGFTDVQALPNGKTVTLRYRVALDASMTDGVGGVEATAVVPDGLVVIGKADLPFTVSKDAAATPNGHRPTVLPFSGLTSPRGVTVSAGGEVYVADTGNDRVLKLAAGANEQAVLPFTDLHSPSGVAVDAAGNVYVTDYVSKATDFTVPNSRVLKLAAGSNEQTVLPFTGLGHVQGVAVDNAGNVYVTDSGDGNTTTVVKLAAGSNDQTVLPFTDLKSATGLAVDNAGTVYVGDGPNNRVVKLAAGANDQTVLPITGFDYPDGMAVDSAGNAFVIDDTHRQVVKLAAGSNEQTVLPFTSLNDPTDVAVDGAGTVYVIDISGFGRVVKLAAG